MSYSSTVLADGAVGYWRLGESAFAQAAVDAAGNQNGAFQNNTGWVFSQPGIPGAGGDTAITFTAANGNWILVTDVAAHHVGDVWTTEAWYKRTAAPAAQENIFGSYNSGGPGMAIDATGHIFLVKAATAIISTSTAAFTDITTFHHCVCTKNGATCKIYLDAVDVTGTVTNSTTTNSNQLMIGSNVGFGNYAAGTMDEVALYPTALSLATVQNHYALGIPTFSSPGYINTRRTPRRRVIERI